MAEFPSLQSTGPSSLQMPESLPSLEREPEFVNASDVDRFRCPLHNGLLVEPQQTKCGHRFCKSILLLLCSTVEQVVTLAMDPNDEAELSLDG